MSCQSQRKPAGVRMLIGKFKNTPFHPQWFAFFRDPGFIEARCSNLNGIVVDVGCADAKPKKYLPDNATYVGIDYPSTATNWYGTRPDLFADAQALPLAQNSADHVLLFDVLEHLPNPRLCLAEVQRVLRPNGSLTIQVPFLYPVHDAPLDFQRWTQQGLERAAQEHGFSVSWQQALGHPVETAALNANIAMSQTVLNWWRGRNPLAVMAILLPVAVVVVNCLAWLAARCSGGDDMMPYAYRMTWIKT
jgi:SAM-dependent methyltransferase